MMWIRSVLDLRNKIPTVEKIVNEVEPVYLTKNRYRIMTECSIKAVVLKYLHG